MIMQTRSDTRRMMAPAVISGKSLGSAASLEYDRREQRIASVGTVVDAGMLPPFVS
jgi:hypothetical protein